MDEKSWVQQIADRLASDMTSSNLLIEVGKKVPYAYEVLHHSGDGKIHHKLMSYETDLLISEKLPNDLIKPRIIVEAKIKSVTTHDAITYSHKASTHKQVHPYLRYGIMLGRYCQSLWMGEQDISPIRLPLHRPVLRSRTSCPTQRAGSACGRLTVSSSSQPPGTA